MLLLGHRIASLRSGCCVRRAVPPLIRQKGYLMPSSDLDQFEEVGGRRITVLEALAESTSAIGPSQSNQSTQSAADADD